MEDVVVPRRRLHRRRLDPQELVVSVVAEHAESLLRVARRHTACAADAEDAYQRALEIFVRQAHRLDPASAYKWLHTVVKHEAWAIGEARARLVTVDVDEELDALADGRHLPSVEERSERFDDLARAAEALRRLKPQEVTALVLKAQGLSYQEIAERQGWTYTKVNRCLTEGRKSLVRRYESIQSGAECERWLPVLSAMADGEATSEQLLDARPHLRNCAACRSVLGGMHRSGAAVAALLPPGVLAGAGVTSSGLLDRLGELVLGVQERVVAPVVKAQGAIEAAGGTKLAAVAASTVALAGGGVAVERQARSGDASAAGRSSAADTTVASPSAVGAEELRAPVATAPLKPVAVPEAPEASERRETPRPAAPENTASPAAEFAPESTAAPDPPAPPAIAPPTPTAPPQDGASDEFGFGG